MKVWAYCGHDWVEATRHSAGVEPVLCPPADSRTVDLEQAAAADLVYLNLHGLLGQRYFYGQRDKQFGPTALDPELVRTVDWSGAVIFAEVCWSAVASVLQPIHPRLGQAGSEMARAFLDAGAKAFIGSTTEAFGRIRPVRLLDGEADRLGYFFRLMLARGMTPGRALATAKRWLRMFSFPLDADDRATLESFVCLEVTSD